MLAVFTKLGISTMVLLGVCWTTVSAKDPEEIWRELGKLSGEERQRFLVSKAKAEGEVVWYTVLPADHLAPLQEDFERRYPEVKIKVWRGRGEGMVNRILTESRAAKVTADVIVGSNEHFPILRRADLLGKYNSPERQFYSDTHKDREGYWTSLLDVVAVIAYNTRLVSKEQAPKRYEDFLDPRWRASFAIDTNPDRAVMAWIKLWGPEKTEKFLRALMKNEASLRSGHTLIAQQLCAGEFKAAVELYAFRLADFKEKGCPVEMVFPDPTPGAMSPLYVARQAQRPHAAALLVDYLLSAAGQKILAGKRYHSGHRAIKLGDASLDLEKRRVGLLLLTPDDAEQLTKKYLEIRERHLLLR